MTEKNSALPRKALKVRQRVKSTKPAFERPESWKYDKFSLSWRRPRGLDNKVRRKIKGWPPMPCMGYKGPKIARGLHPSGYREVLVNNVAELAVIDPAVQAARIAHTVGKRKRALIVEEAKNLKIKVLNAKVTAKKEETEEGAEEETEEAKGKEAGKKEEKPAKAVKKEKKKEAPKPVKKTKAKAKKGEKKQ
jgi:large subunit ribosomal protein L32e